MFEQIITTLLSLALVLVAYALVVAWSKMPGKATTPEVKGGKLKSQRKHTKSNVLLSTQIPKTRRRK
jgi:beta-lactam-binding protein with PASTA domain